MSSSEVLQEDVGSVESTITVRTYDIYLDHANSELDNILAISENFYDALTNFNDSVNTQRLVKKTHLLTESHSCW